MGKFADFFDENGAAKRYWNSSWMGSVLWLSGAILTIYWILCIPPPGYAIGALAVVAGVMSVREMKTLGKVTWVVLLICLLMTEFRAINADRVENQRQQKEFFESQKTGFSGIAGQEKQDFDATAASLKLAIDGLNQTLKQTHPYAAIRFDKIEFAGPPPGQILANAPMKFNFYYTDNGAETASNVRYLGKLYVGKQDDKADQFKLAKNFEADWSSGKEIVTTRSVLVPVIQSLSSIERTLSDEEAKQLSQYATLYFFVRFEYSDSTGKWRTDGCTAFQREEEPSKLDYNVFHNCMTFTNFHYQIKQQ